MFNKSKIFSNLVSVVGGVMILSLFLFHNPVNAAGNVTVSLSPSSGSIGHTAQTINLNINTVGTAISTTSIYISYDPAVLSISGQVGTITELSNSSLFSAADDSSGVFRIQAGTLSSYTGSGLLATLSVRVLDSVTTLQSTNLTITDKSTVTMSGDQTLANQLSSSSLNVTSTYTADPSYTSKEGDLPSTALFDDISIPLTIAFVLMIMGIVVLRNKEVNEKISSVLLKTFKKNVLGYVDPGLVKREYEKDVISKQDKDK